MNGGSRGRVVVTGIGVVTPAGIGLERFWHSILRGTSHVRERTFFPGAEKRGRAAGVAEFEPQSLFAWDRPAEAAGQDRLFRIAETAIFEALSGAGLDNSAGKPLMAEAGLYVSSAIGPISTMEAIVREQSEGAMTPDDAWHAFSFGHIAAKLAERCGLGGPYALLPTGCSGGCDAVGYALAALRCGAVDLAVAGAFEAPVTPLVEAAFARINATSSRDCFAPRASCPFDTMRDGFVLGEGGGALVLEREATAIARGAIPLGVIAGYGSVCSAFHMTDIHESGEAIARSIELALADAGVSADEIDHVNLHGSSTPMNDVAEANALRKTLQNWAEDMPVTSLKSQIGHALAAANAIELAAAVMTVFRQVIPPTTNLFDQDPRVGLNVVSPWLRQAKVRNVLKTASGFGGIHSAVVVSRYGA
ncbi:beta-ketoacyl-[acyl-carrier-protein] synthase family protein [Mesorhizobium helmanticense]|uniref:Ketosynthase family 3 (KS3) domain-containing protein n=1 Tax=Mesorhizobium helmanticense TaxID=1776423 RepID=A0A2T4IM30_9HYPH|nr:beta-ketoacyl-[acyl-carrier-protein] synthase family protein [Mesorhizobium helmanticense]PTE06653.1 hypothetical protein C9427_30465 [Mesorhizobium helmanticense]